MKKDGIYREKMMFFFLLLIDSSDLNKNWNERKNSGKSGKKLKKRVFFEESEMLKKIVKKNVKNIQYGNFRMKKRVWDDKNGRIDYVLFT